MSTTSLSFVKRHSLSIASAAVVVVWICLYTVSDPASHLGSFFGNAIADWTGVVVTVIATKYLYEVSKPKDPHPWHDHSLTIFLVVTGIAWAVLYWRMNPEGKWGQVVGNIVSEWTQILGFVLMTKRLIERKAGDRK